MSVGRNAPCPCGSGKKYKQCCGASSGALPAGASGDAHDLATLVGMVNQGRLREAEEQASLLLRSQPQAGMLWKILGVAQLRQGRDALVALRRAAELLPQDAEAHGNLGAALRDRREWEAALASLRQALQLDSRNLEALSDAGDCQLALGRPGEAVLLYQWALQLEPRRRDLLNNLGNALAAAGEPQKAAECYRRALALKGDDPEVMCNLALALRQLGQQAEALSLAQRALSLAPTAAAVHNTLGLLSSAQGERAAAIASFREALRLNPTSVDTLSNLGSALWEEGERREALALYEQALRLDPKRAESHVNLGNLLLESRRVDAAAASFRAALALAANATRAHLGLAAAQRVQGRFAEAEASAETALKLEPTNPEALALLGELRADHGRFEEAHELFERAIRVAPEFAGAYGAIAAHRRMTRADESWLTGARGLLERPLPLAQEIDLRFALGKYFDDVGEYEQAFASYREANELTKRFGSRYDRARFDGLIERLIGRFDAGFAAAAHPGASDSRRPVFIVGMPRSGTSLTEQILASHPQVFGAGEVRFWDRGYAAFEQTAPEDQARRLAELAQEYLARVGSVAGEATRIIDKMPANFLYCGLIHAVFPRARIIHMRRHPLDTCLSVYFQNFYNVSPYANDLDSLAHYYGHYLRLMRHWRRVLPAGTLLEVPYEALVEDPELWTRRMLEFVGLPWDARCLDFHQTERVVITASRWQVRQKISKGSSGRWQHYEAHVAPLRHLVAAAELP